jgi:lipopolysaccharide export system protein LptC
MVAPLRDASDPARAEPAGSTAARSRSGPRLPLYRSGYSRFVLLAKYALPVVAGVVMMLVVVWPELKSKPEKFSIGLSDVKIETAGGQRVINARFTGVDSNNRPFSITAESVVRAGSDDNGVELSQPKADVTLAGDSWVAIAAPKGIFRRAEETLDLSGGVDLFHEDGYEFRTAEARLNFSTSAASGGSPIRGQGPFGTIEAQGFRVPGTGDSIFFTGKSRLLVYPDAPKPNAPKADVPKSGAPK